MNFLIRLFAGIGSLSLEESIIVFLMASIIIGEIFRSAKNKSWLSIYKPTNLVCLIFGYYVLIGPILACGQPNGRGTFYHGIDHRDFLVIGWEAGLVSLICIILGFYFFSKTAKHYKMNVGSPPGKAYATKAPPPRTRIYGGQ